MLLKILFIVLYGLAGLLGLFVAILVLSAAAFQVQVVYAERAARRARHLYRCPDCLEYLRPDPLFKPHVYTHHSYVTDTGESFFPGYDTCKSQSRVMSLLNHADVKGFLFCIYPERRK